MPILLAVLGLGVVGYLFYARGSLAGQGAEVVLTGADDGKTIAARVGQYIALRLPQPNPGNRWVFRAIAITPGQTENAVVLSAQSATDAHFRAAAPGDAIVGAAMVDAAGTVVAQIGITVRVA